MSWQAWTDLYFKETVQTGGITRRQVNLLWFLLVKNNKKAVIKIWMIKLQTWRDDVDGLFVGFYGISTFVSYLIPNPVYMNISIHNLWVSRLVCFLFCWSTGDLVGGRGVLYLSAEVQSAHSTVQASREGCRVHWQEYNHDNTKNESMREGCRVH